MFNLVINTVEKMFPTQLNDYLKNNVDKNRHEVKDGIEVWSGKYVDKKRYTFEKSNYIKALGHKIFLDQEIVIQECEYGEKKHLMSAVEMAGKLTNCIKWQDGRSETAKDMVIGNHKIRASITYDTFTEKREKLIDQITKALTGE